MASKIFDSIIIGGGQAGLVTGYYLQQHGLDFLILDANDEIGGSWQHYWDSLSLFSPAKYSSLDGLPFPADPNYYPSRQDMIDYLQQYQQQFDLPVVNNTTVATIRKNNHFRAITQDGKCYEAKSIISATGAFTKPYIPTITGQDDFTGEQLHSYSYKSPETYQAQRLVVVGSNNSAVQIAYELAQVADVTLAVRKNIKFRPIKFLGKSVFFYLHDTGFDMLPIGCTFGLCVSDSVYDDGRYQQAVQAGNPNKRPMFKALTKHGVIWANDKHENIDTILYATGFSGKNKPYLRDLQALNDKDLPQHHKGVSTSVDGLFFIGLEGQIAPASATVRGVSRDAKYIANQVAAYL